MLTVELVYKPETQPPGRSGFQSVDVSIIDEFGTQVWADSSTRTTTGARRVAKAGGEYRIVLWYTYPKLEYQLKTYLD
jgi:hypothetical protein